jgi:hypothetical protein
MRKYIALIHDKNGLKKITKNLKDITFYPLNINIYVYLKKNKDFFVIKPNISDYSILKCVSRLRNFESKIKKDKIFQDNLDKYEKETLLNLLHVSTSSALHLYYEIKEFDNFLIFNNNKWISTTDVMLAHRILFLGNIEYLKKIIGLQNKKPYFQFIVKFINYLSINSSSENKSIWTTSRNYGFEHIHKESIKKNKDIKIYNLINSGRWIFKTLLKSLFINNILNHNKNLYNITLIEDDRKINHTDILTIIKNNSDKIINNISETLSNFLSIGLNKTISKFNYADLIIKKTNPKVIYAHHLRWFDAVALAHSGNINLIPVYLIAHGSTPSSKYASEFYVLSKLASGMSYSEFANTTIIHSPISENMVKIMQPNIKKLNINFWKLTNNYENVPIKNTKNTKIILHAGTSKNYATRLWIYETTFEYIKGLSQLINAVSELEDTKLIIRLRSDLASSTNNIISILPKNKNVIFKTSGNFNEDLINSDLLITHFSTTTEQALNIGIPVLLFGGNNRYIHIDGSIFPPDIKKSFPIYVYKKNNLKDYIDRILKFHNNKNIFKGNYSNLIWNDNLNNFKDLIDIDNKR